MNYDELKKRCRERIESENEQSRDQRDVSAVEICEATVDAIERLQAELAEAVLKEREACARMVEDMGAKLKISPVTALYTAAAIRERTDGR